MLWAVLWWRRSCSVVVAALVVGGLVGCGWSKPAMQQVMLVAGGGRSDADSGAAASLRLLPYVSALTVAPDGVVWLAGEDSDDSHQLVSITPSGRAQRIRLGAGAPRVDSLAVSPNGTVWAASTDTVLWRLQGRALIPAYGARRQGTRDFSGPFVADGQRLSSAHLGVVGSVAFDAQGRLVFQETAADWCERIRRVGSDGIVTTLVGGKLWCSAQGTRTQYEAARFPDAAIKAPTLAIEEGSSFALGPHGRIYVYTPRSVLAVDPAGGGITRVLGAPTSRSLGVLPQIDNGRAPYTASKDATDLVVNKEVGSGIGMLSSGNVAVADDGSLAVLTSQVPAPQSRAFTWQVKDSRIKVEPSRAISVQEVRAGRATTATAVRGMLAFRGRTLLEGVSRPEGALIVAIPRPH